MNLLISNSRKQSHSNLQVVSDKPSVCGTLFYMPTPKNAPCNKCRLHPKYPNQGLCRKCLFEKAQLQNIKKRKSRFNVVENLDGEEWVEINEAKGYFISNKGRVKSANYRCRLKDEEASNEKVLKLREARKGGYLKADLDKYNWRPSVHRLVGLHFIPNPNNYPQVLHKDGDKQNNDVDNLYWGTISQNVKDYIEQTKKDGIVREKMLVTDVLSIYNSNNSVQSLAIEFNVQPSTIWMIKNGYRWSTVTGHTCTDKRKNK